MIRPPRIFGWLLTSNGEPFEAGRETPRPVVGAEPRDLPVVVSNRAEWLYVQEGGELPGEVARISLRTGRREQVRRLPRFLHSTSSTG